MGFVNEILNIYSLKLPYWKICRCMSEWYYRFRENNL